MRVPNWSGNRSRNVTSNPLVIGASLGRHLCDGGRGRGPGASNCPSLQGEAPRISPEESTW